jgi:molybdenum cofactor cytidylyltransferase
VTAARAGAMIGSMASGSDAKREGDVHVVVLAAGRSSRMGFPKALAEIAGELALARVLRLARSQRLPVRVVLGFHADAIRARVPLDEREVVVNPAPERGQSSSLRVGAASLPEGSALVLWPVDHAHVAEATLLRLLAEFRARAPGVALVVPSHAGRRGHPLLGDSAVRSEFAALRDNEPGHVVLRRDPKRVLHVVVDDPAVVADFDAPGEIPGATPTPPPRTPS